MRHGEGNKKDDWHLMMSCARHLSSIQELVDGTIGSIRRAELESHLDECEDCRAMLADLERIRDAAAELDDRRPPDRVWLQIAGRLRQEGRIHDAPPARPQGHGSFGIFALAAGLVLAVGASMFLLLPRAPQPPAPVVTQAPVAAPASAADVGAVANVQSELQQADQHYEAAITQLQQIVSADQKALDPQVVATLQKSGRVIDQAIAESRAALRTEPASAVALKSLFDALKQKVTLLQDTIALMNEMRKGNDAGAARLLNKS